MSFPQTIVVGIDGATFDLIEPWVKEGELPTLSRYLESGASSELVTTYPPLTAPAWVSFMTGCNPGRHGVYDFLTGDPESEEVVNHDSIGISTLWDLLSSREKRLGLVNVPVTFPPPEVNGHVISGPLSSSDPSESCHPSSLIRDLEEATELKWWNRSSSDITPSKPLQYYQAHHQNNSVMAEYSLWMLREYNYDFFMVLFDLVDSISHFFWHYMDESHPYHEQRGEAYQNAILRAYKFVDEFLARLEEHLDSTTDVVLMSDHGFGPIEHMVNLNNFFQDQGLLSLKSRPSTVMKRAMRGIGINPNRLMRMAEFMGLDSLAFMLPKGVRNKIIGTMGNYSDVNWDRTICYSRGHMGQVHLVDRLKEDEQEYHSTRERVIRVLKEELRHPDTGEKLITDILVREEMYEGPYLDRAPDLFLIMNNYQCITYPLFSGGPDLLIPHIQEGRYANHRMNGIFCGRGPSFRTDHQFDGAEIVDLAPTLLYLQGLPVAEHMDGELLVEALDQERLREREPSGGTYEIDQQTESPGKTDEAIERLRGLGYLGS